MFKKILIATLLVVTPLAAQRGGGGGGGGAAAPTLFATFADELGLDKKTQVPAAQELFSAAQKEAAPIATEMINTRTQMLSAEMEGVADAAKAASAAHTAAATKMVAIETRLFSKVYAMLKPDQQKKAPKAFDRLAGIFRVTGTPNRGGSGGRGGGGAGGADSGGGSGRAGGGDLGGDQ